jgi:uncharacterized membrane protein
VTEGNGYRRSRIYAAGTLVAVLVAQAAADVLVPDYDLAASTLAIELGAVLLLLGLEGLDILRGR